MTLNFPTPRSDSCIVLLIRHAATANNDANPPRVQGSRSDPPLSPHGWEQAKGAGRWLATAPIKAIYSSPLTRAKQTADAIAEHHQLHVKTVAALVECDVGHWEGRTWHEIEQSEPEAFRAFVDDPARFPYEHGENLTQVWERTQAALNSLAASHAGELIAIVSHNVVGRVCVAQGLKMPLALARAIHLDNAGVSVLRCARGEVRALSVNIAVHLPGL